MTSSGETRRVDYFKGTGNVFQDHKCLFQNYFSFRRRSSLLYNKEQNDNWDDFNLPLVLISHGGDFSCWTK